LILLLPCIFFSLTNAIGRNGGWTCSMFYFIELQLACLWTNRFFTVNGHQILNPAFPAGEWISAIVSECTCNCSGVSNQKFPFQPKAGINVIWVYCFLVYLLFHGWYHIIGSWLLSLPCYAVCLFCCFRLGFAEVIVMMLLYCTAFYWLVNFYFACRMEKPYQMDLLLFHLMDCFPHCTGKVRSF